MSLEQQKKVILVLASNPCDTDRLRLDEEFRELLASLQRSKLRESFELKSFQAIRLQDIYQALLDHSPQIVHFCGHGDKGLLVEGDSGQAVTLNEHKLAELLGKFADHVQCVVPLTFVHSEALATATANYIAHVVGMRDAISDKAAIKFAIAFYDAVWAGKSFNQAFEFGHLMLDIADMAGNAQIPILKMGSPPTTQNPSQRTLPSTTPEAHHTESSFAQTQLYACLDQYVSKDLDEISDLYYTGKPRSALEKITKLKASAQWTILDNSLKAKFLRIEANIHLQHDIVQAKQLADEA